MSFGLAPGRRGDSSPDGHVFRTVDYLLRPKSIALVGASDSSRGGWVQEIYDNLEFSGFPGEAVSGQSEAARAVGPAGLSELRGDPGARRSRADRHPDGRSRRHARRGFGERPQMRADLCRAIRRRRRCRGRKARAGVAGAVRQARASHFRPELHGLARAPRKAPALSGQARARTEAGPGRRRVPVRRNVPVLAAAGGAARPRLFLRDIERQRARSRSRRLHQFPGRGRAHQDHRLPGRRRPPAAGVHGGCGKGARAPASRSCWSRSGAASAARRRR